MVMVMAVTVVMGMAMVIQPPMVMAIITRNPRYTFTPVYFTWRRVVDDGSKCTLFIILLCHSLLTRSFNLLTCEESANLPSSATTTTPTTTTSTTLQQLLQQHLHLIILLQFLQQFLQQQLQQLLQQQLQLLCSTTTTTTAVTSSTRSFNLLTLQAICKSPF